MDTLKPHLVHQPGAAATAPAANAHCVGVSVGGGAGPAGGDDPTDLGADGGTSRGLVTGNLGRVMPARRDGATRGGSGPAGVTPTMGRIAVAVPAVPARPPASPVAQAVLLTPTAVTAARAASNPMDRFAVLVHVGWFCGPVQPPPPASSTRSTRPAAPARGSPGSACPTSTASCWRAGGCGRCRTPTR